MLMVKNCFRLCVNSADVKFNKMSKQFFRNQYKTCHLKIPKSILSQETTSSDDYLTPRHDFGY